MRNILAALLLLAPLPFPALAAATPCDPCILPNGTYRAMPPPGWDGHAALPLLLFLHGYHATGSDMITDDAISGPAAKLGFLLVAPDGVQGSWAHAGSPSHARDDISFVRAVLADVKSRWPIDSRAIVAAGFSQGSSMVWDLACHDAPDFTAFLPFSGGFWRPMPTACTSGAVNLRHVHGRADTTVPLAGRHLFGPYYQEDIRQGFSRWLAEDRCEQPPATQPTRDGLDCDVWAGCGSGRSLQLCLHAGGHEMHAEWLESGLRWALGLRRP